jgi:exodeoxyribonuclease V alpha subunit
VTVRHPLDPRGALRTALAPSAQDQVLRNLRLGAQRCDLGDEGLYLAEEILAADSFVQGDREPLGFLILAVTLATRQGAARLPLDPDGPLRPLIASIHGAATSSTNLSRIMKTIREITTGGTIGSTIGWPGQRRPLIVDDGCVYPERYFQLECQVAELLRHRLDAAASSDGPLLAAVDDALRDLASRPSRVPLSPEQLACVRAAASQPLTVVSGGPGTGKTQLVAALVRTLARTQGSELQLAAPTGKAANRLSEVLGEVLAEIQLPSTVDQELLDRPPVATTLHRLLGWSRDQRSGGGTVRGHTVIIDESSMVDLELFSALLRALPAATRLVLVGDPHQLPSVSPGQVFAELVTMTAGTAAGVTLTHNFRVNADAGGDQDLITVAEAVRLGTRRWTRGSRGARAPAPTPTFAGVEVVDPRRNGSDRRREVVRDSWLRTVDDPSYRGLYQREYLLTDRDFDQRSTQALRQLLALLGRRRVLTVTRGLDTGSVALSGFLHDLALGRATALGQPDLLPGEPVVMIENDHHRGLHNGDHGVVARVRTVDGPQRYYVVFQQRGQLVPVPIDAIRSQIELAWAMTVHKSQGSEFDEVVLVLPEDDLPIATRELVYTAITRARRSAVVIATTSLLDSATARQTARSSGLSKRVRAPR